MDFEKMKRKELQELCKKHGIPANLTNREMANRLASLLQKPEEPISRGRLSSNNVEEIDSESDPKEARPKMKKVRFSPNNETHIIVCSDSESAASEKRRGRQRQPRKRDKTSAGGEASAKTRGSPLRRRKSSSRTPAQADEEDVAQVLSPPVGKRRAERLSSSVQNENAHDKENVVSNTRQLRSRTVVVDKNAEVLDGAKVNVGKNGTKVDSKRKKHRDGLSETEIGYQDMPTERTQGRKVTRQSKRDAEKDIDPTLLVMESERIENSRRVTRSSFQPVQEAAVVNANNLQGGDQGESVKDSQTKDLPKRRSRNSRKSTAPSKGLPDEIVPLQGSNVIAERVIDVGNTRRSKRNKTRGGESPTLSSEIAPETEYRVPNSKRSIHESKRGGVRILEEQKMSDQSSDTSKGLERIDSRLVEGDVYAVPKDDGEEGDLNDKKSSKRANRMVLERRALEPEADSASVQELPLRRSRRLTIMTTAQDGEFQTDLADKMIMSQRRLRRTAFRQDMVANTNIMKRSTKAKEVQDLNFVLQGELPTELPRQLKRNPSRCQSIAASKKQKSGSRDHSGGDMTTPHGTSTVQEVVELNALSPVQELLEHENIAEMKEIPDSSIRKEDEEETAVEQELHPVKGKKDMVNSSTGNIDVSNKPTSPDDRDQEEVHLDADGAHTNNQSPQVLHAASSQDENSAGLESIERQNKANCVISPNIPFSAERSNNMSEQSVELVTSTKEIENQSFLSGEDKSSTKVKLVLEDQFDGLRGTINADGNPVDTVDAADNLSPYESKNITFTIGMQHMKSEHGLQSSNIAAEDAITRSNTSDNAQRTVHTASEEKNRREVQSSGYSSMSRIRTLEVEQDSFSETDSPAGTPHIGENDRQYPQDTLFCEERTLKEAGDNVNESQDVFQATEHPVEGVTVVFDENSRQISQEEEGGALEVELESTSKDIEQESLEDISMIFPGEYTDMIEKHKVSVQFQGLGSEKHVGSYRQTAEEANKHEDGRAKLNAIEFSRCSMTISDEEGFYGQEKELDMVTVTKAEGSASHSMHPMHFQDGYGNISAKKEDRKERASDVKDPLSFPQDCMEENVQGIAITEHCSEALGYDNYLEEGNKIPSGLNSARKETESPVAYETLRKDATRKLCPEEWSPPHGEEILKSISPVRCSNSLGTDNLLTGSNKWIMDGSTCQDAATVQMKSKSDECYSGSSYINVLKAESDKDNQQLALGEFLGGDEVTKLDAKEAMEGNRELSPETRAANASGIIGTDAIPLESNKSTSSELAVKEQHHAAEEADGLMLNSEISLGALNAVNEDNVQPESQKELDLELHESIFEEKDVEDAQSLENSSEACFPHVAPEDKAVKRTQSSDRSTQLKTPENKGGGISPFNSDGSKHENSYYCPEGEFKVCHDQAGKVVRNSAQTEWIRAHNSAAIRLDRCSLPCVTVESKRCNTDIVVTDTHDMKGGTANETHEDIEDYSTNNHDVEFQKSGGMNLILSNVTPFSSSKDLRDLDGDVEAPQRCNKEKICDFDCWEDEEIQLDLHRRMHSYGLSCIEMSTRSAEICDGNPDSIIGSVGNNYVTKGDVSELSEQSLSHDSGNPKIEETADVTDSETTLDNTVDGRYESDDRVRMEEDIMGKVDQSPVTAGEDPDNTIGSLGNNYATKGDESDISKQSLSRDTGNSKIEDSADVTNSDIAHDSTGDARYESDDMVRMEEDMVPRKIDENPVSAGEDPMPLHELNTDFKEQHSVEGDEYNAPTEVTVSNISGKNSDRNEGFHIDKLFTEDECGSKEVPCEEGAKEQFLFCKVGKNQALSSYDLDVSRPMDSFYIESGSDCVMTTTFHSPSKLDGLSDSVSNPNHITSHANYLFKQGSSTGLFALSSSENSNNETLLVQGQDKSHMVTGWEMNSISGHSQFDDPIKMIEDTCEKRLEDENFGDGGNAIVLESEKNAPLVDDGPEDEYKHTENLEKHEKGLQDINAGDDGDVVALEFKKNALLVAEGPEDEHKHKKAVYVDSIAPSDGFISREMLKEYKRRVQDANAGDSGGIVVLENELNAVLVAEEAEDVHKHEKAEESVNAIAPSDGLVLGEKLEEHEKRLQDTSTGDGGDVVSSELKEGALLAAEGLEVEPKYEKAEESVELIVPFDGFIMREELEECEKILQDTKAGDSGDVAALEFEENAYLVAEGPEDEHKHKIDEFVAPIAPSDGFMLREKLDEHGKEFLDVNALDGCGDVVASELKENALLAAEGIENEHKHRKAEESVDSIAHSDEFLSGEKLEKEINNFRNDERKCPEVSGNNEGSVDKINGRDSGGLMGEESREMTTLSGESDLNSGMLNAEETEVRLGSGNREDARGTTSDVIKFEKISSLGTEEQWEEHRIQGEVTEDIGSIKDSVDVLDVGDHDGSGEQDDICAMIQEYMDLELQKAVSGDIFVNKETEVHGSCVSYNAPGDKPILEVELNESREEVLVHSAGADTSSLGDGSNIKHSIEQTDNLPAVCTENVSHDLASMNLSVINDGNVAQKANMKKPKFSSYQKNRKESNPDETKKVALRMKSATVMRAKSRGNLIDKTPKKLFSTFEMKENMPSTKKEQIGSATATKTLTKRRALEDLQKKQIWK